MRVLYIPTATIWWCSEYARLDADVDIYIRSSEEVLSLPGQRTNWVSTQYKWVPSYHLKEITEDMDESSIHSDCN